jgi:uncharacterized protein YwqG
MEYLNSLRQPALALRSNQAEPFNRIGGLPNLPSSLLWPRWKDKPLSFLCQLDLSRIPLDCEYPEIPSSGRLYFFYDQEQGTWGFDPKDKGSWQILYTTDTVVEGRAVEAPGGLAKECVYKSKSVGFFPFLTYPDWQDNRVASLNLGDISFEEYIELRSLVFEKQPSHHLFGHPSPVQGNDMDLECQLASNGIYLGDAKGYKDVRARELESGRADWTLLLQLDSDDDTGMMWGDCGMLYFWIRKQDIKVGRFENCWMVLQCF